MILEEVIFTNETSTAMFFIVKFKALTFWGKPKTVSRSAFMTKREKGYETHYFFADDGSLKLDNQVIEKMIEKYEQHKNK